MSKHFLPWLYRHASIRIYIPTIDVPSSILSYLFLRFFSKFNSIFEYILTRINSPRSINDIICLGCGFGTGSDCTDSARENLDG